MLICLGERGVDPAGIDCIIVATMTPDHPTPSTAAIVQRKIGAINAWGFDIAAACAGFVYAVNDMDIEIQMYLLEAGIFTSPL